MMNGATAALSIRTIIPQTRPHWVGNGFHVFPVFQNLAFSNSISPFLMLDYAAPKDFPPGKGKRERRGVGQHPHRGFETVTIAFQGEVEHGDSVGNHDVIGPGDVQWMTAARGIIHEEYHSESFSEAGGTFEMVQLWVNLPAKHKMDAPRYQAILNASIPEVHVPAAHEQEYKEVEVTGNDAVASGVTSKTTAAAKVRLIAGSFRRSVGPANTHTPIDLWDVLLPATEVPVELEMKPGHNVIVFSRQGSVRVGEGGNTAELGPQSVAILETVGKIKGDGHVLRLMATQPNTKLLILAGEPLDEPIAARGPFVMNTNEEIMQANADYRSGRMGR